MIPVPSNCTQPILNIFKLVHVGTLLCRDPLLKHIQECQLCSTYCRNCGRFAFDFLHLSVNHSVDRGVSASGQGGVCHIYLRQTPPGQTPPWADTPQADTPYPVHDGMHSPPPRSACWDTVNKWTVRIPLEYILVLSCLQTPNHSVLI